LEPVALHLSAADFFYKCGIVRRKVCKMLKKLGTIFLALTMIMAFSFTSILSTSYADGTTFDSVSISGSADSNTSYSLSGTTNWVLIKQANGPYIIWTKDTLSTDAEKNAFLTKLQAYALLHKDENVDYGTIKKTSINTCTFVSTATKDNKVIVDDLGNVIINLDPTASNAGIYEIAHVNGNLVVSVKNHSGTLDKGKISHLDWGTYTLPPVAPTTGNFKVTKTLAGDALASGKTATFYFTLFDSSNAIVKTTQSVTLDNTNKSASIT